MVLAPAGISLSGSEKTSNALIKANELTEGVKVRTRLPDVTLTEYSLTMGGDSNRYSLISVKFWQTRRTLPCSSCSFYTQRERNGGGSSVARVS